MSFDLPMRQTRWDVVLRWALLGGALFDLAFGVAVLAAWRRLLPLLKIELPPNPVFVQLAAILTLGLGLAFLVTGLAPWRYHANVTVAAFARLVSAPFLAWSIYIGRLPKLILAMAAAELVLGTLHLIYSRRLAKAAAGPQ